MLLYYFDDSTKCFLYTDVIDDDADMPENATTIAPVNADGTGMYAPTWNGTNWVPMTKEDFEKEFAQPQRPDNVPAVTPAEKQEAQQMLAFAKLQSDVDALKKSQEQGAAVLATLMKQQANNAKGGN